MSTDLVPSASDMLESILEQGRTAIGKQQLVVEKRAYEREIEEHYYKRVKKTMNALWNECGKRTKHDFERDDNTDKRPGYSTPQICGVCNYPIGYDQDGRMKRGIQALAWQARNADKDAGIEWIPGHDSAFTRFIRGFTKRFKEVW